MVLWKLLYYTFPESYINQEQNQIQKEKYQRLYHTFCVSYSIQEQIVLQKDKHRQPYYTFLGLTAVKDKS